MEKNSRELSGVSSDFLDARWFDPIEVTIRDRVRGFIEELVEAELDDALGRSRYQRPGDARMTGGTAGCRHGRRKRQLLGSFGPVTISGFCQRSRPRVGLIDARVFRYQAASRMRRARMPRVRKRCGGSWLECSGNGVSGDGRGCEVRRNPDRNVPRIHSSRTLTSVRIDL